MNTVLAKAATIHESEIYPGSFHVFLYSEEGSLVESCIIEDYDTAHNHAVLWVTPEDRERMN